CHRAVVAEHGQPVRRGIETRMRIVVGVTEVCDMHELAGAAEMKKRTGEVEAVIHLDRATATEADLLTAVNRCGEFGQAALRQCDWPGAGDRSGELGVAPVAQRDRTGAVDAGQRRLEEQTSARDVDLTGGKSAAIDRCAPRRLGKNVA